MKRLKLFFACLLMSILSIGQMWAETATYTVSTASEVTETGDIPDGSSAALTGNAGLNSGMLQITYGKNAVLTLSGYAGCTITGFKMSMKSNSSKGKGSMTLVAGETTLHSVPDAAFNSSNWYGSWSTSAVDVDFTSVMTTDYTVDEDENIVITVTNHGASNSTNSLYIESYTITYEVSSSGGSTPSLSVTPTSWDFGDVASSDAASKVFSVSGSNLTAGTLSISVPEGFSVSPSSISVTEATLAATNVTVSKNTTAIDDYSGNLSISATCGLTEAKTVALEMSVVADPEPTGTFELFSGDIEEGDYVIVSANALSNTVNTNRIASQAVTVSDNKIVNPDAAIVWHIEANGDYWTLYNAEAEKYAGGTSTKNQGALLASVTDYAKWTITGSSTYEFENLGRATGSSDTGNKWLRYNSGNAENSRWACYSTSTGSALTLYKKQVEGQPKAPNFSIPGGNYETAKSVELSCETEDVTIHYTLDGTNPTDASPVYSTALAISSTTTIKAIAIKNNVSSTVASATYTIIVWQTVADVWDDITEAGPLNAHIYGYVSQTNVGGYDNNFYISDNGSTEGNQLYAYRMNMNSFSVAVGDKVKLAGDLTDYQGTKEFKYANQGATQGLVVALEAKGDLQSVAVSSTPTKTEYAANETFDPAGLKVYGTYANGFVGEIAEGITWGNDLTDGKVIESTTVHVTATVSEITSPAYDVPVTVAAKTLVSIAVGTDAYTIYTGEALPQPVVTATFSEGEPEDVSAFAVYDSESVFNTELIDDPDPQTITVSYTFGGATQTATYTVSVQDYENADNAPYSVTEALHIITAAIGNTESAREIVVTGTVSAEKVSNYKNRYKISDGANELLVYNGKGFNDEAFTDANYPKFGDVMIVKGKVIYFNNNTPEFASGKSYPLSQIRPATIAIEDVASFEVGTADLAVTDLTVTTPSDGDITFVSGDDAVATIEANAIHAVAPGTVTITANLAATENDNALNYAATSTTFSVTVVAPATKYAITFDGNGATGGDAPEFASEATAGANITLPANTYTYTGYTFTGWKVYDENEEEVTVTANAFEMPASPVTIKAQWAEIPVWAYTYTSNVTLTGAKVKFYGEETEYDAVKAGTGKVAGSVDITIPAQATKLHFHAYGWNDETVGLTVTAPAGVTVSPATEISINSNSGIASNSPFTLAEGSTPMTDAYYVVELSGNDDEIELTFTATSGKRFVLFGVNQEDGIVPVLQSLAVSGDLENKTYEAGAAINPAGLTVMGTYTLGGTPQAPVDVTDQVEEWLYDALQVGDESITISAKIGTVTSAGFEITGLTVTDPTPRFETNPTSYISFGSKEQGATITARDLEVTLVNVSNASVEITGTGAAAFSVDEDALTGNATLHVSASSANVGTFAATLTISDDEGVAADKEISLSLTVTEPETPETAVSTSTKWVAATAADLVDGAEVLITGVKDDVTYAMGGQNKNNRAAVAASVDGEDVLTPGENTMSFTLVAQETEGVFALRTSNGKYLYAAASGDNYMKTQGNVDANAQWTISATSAVAESSSNRNVMQFNGGSSLFSCYNTASQTAIQFYVEKQETPEPPSYGSYERNGLTIGNYATICLPNGGTIEGAKLFDLEYYDGASTLYLLEVNGNAMVAGRPYIFLPSATSIEVFYTDDANEPAGSFNGLVGSYSETTILANAGNYILWKNAYYFVDSQARVGANRAYIHMEGVPDHPTQQQQGDAPRRRVGMSVHGEQTVTDIDALNASEAPVKVMINGQIFILRGEKMYDATGRLVK